MLAVLVWCDAFGYTVGGRQTYFNTAGIYTSSARQASAVDAVAAVVVAVVVAVVAAAVVVDAVVVVVAVVVDDVREAQRSL